MHMELMEKIRRQEYWEEFLEFKISQDSMRKKELEALKVFVEQKKYVDTVDRICAQQRLSTPVLHVINKIATRRKRIVFKFPMDENFILKLLSYLMREYDCLFEDNLFSFRSGRSVRSGIHSILRTVNLRSAWSYKIDIHDYFNSVDPDRMIALLQQYMPEEPQFIALFTNVLKDPYVLREGERVEWRKGIMAGMPMSGFFANLFLTHMDRWFAERSIPYVRYSDDVIVFAKTPEEIREYETVIKNFLAAENLEINQRKVVQTAPGEKIQFLGFEFNGSSINLSDISVQKLKDKMRRKARKLYRWKLKKGVPDIAAVRSFIRFLNHKFYNNRFEGEITWARWYFPLLTEDDRLAEIDNYSIDCMRYIAYGNHSKKSYSLRYKTIQENGYHSLVNSFWRFKNGTYDKYERSNEEPTAPSSENGAASSAGIKEQADE